MCNYIYSDVAANLMVCMPEIQLNVQGIFKLLTKIKQGSVSGPDNFPNTDLKSGADIISCYLVVIFAVSFNCGSLPLYGSARVLSRSISLVPKLWLRIIGLSPSRANPVKQWSTYFIQIL